MFVRARSFWVWALLAIPMTSCQDVTSDPDVAPVMITTNVFPGAEQRLEGVELCETGTRNCERTNANGEATLYLPFEVETSFTRTKPGYASYLLPLVVPTSGIAFHLSMASDDRLAEQHENVMSPYPMRGTGTIVITVTPNVQGVTLDLEGATGKTFYTDDNFDWSLDLTATAYQGQGGVTEVSPGDDYRLELGGTADGCVVEKGWPSPFEDSVRLLVREGFLTDIRVICP